MRSKSFYRLRISLLNEVTARMYISFLQVHFNRCITNFASEALPKNQTSLYARCVCVYHLNRCKTSTLQGAAGNVIVLQPTKTAMTFCDIDPGRWIDVPANFQKWEEAQPKNLHVVSCEILIYCTVVAIWSQFWSFTISSAASEPSSVFSPKPCRRQYF